MEIPKIISALQSSYPHSRNYIKFYKGKWVQAFVTTISGIVWVDISNTYDWSMVLKATINQSQETVVHPNDLRSHCSESL